METVGYADSPCWRCTDAAPEVRTTGESPRSRRVRPARSEAGRPAGLSVAADSHRGRNRPRKRSVQRWLYGRRRVPFGRSNDLRLRRIAFVCWGHDLDAVLVEHVQDVAMQFSVKP